MIIVDGTAIAYRSYYGLIKANLKTRDGRECGAIYGFLKSIASLLKDFDNSDIVVIFDSPGPTFRKEMYSEYKANREKMPDSLIGQIEALVDGLKLLGFPVLRIPGVEADDVIASIASEFEHIKLKIITNDKDLMQLINENLTIVSPGKKREWMIYDRENVFNKFGVYPEQIKDFLSLVGDSSDNIPGVPGIGPKTASKLLLNSSNLDNLLEKPEEFTSKKIADKLIEFKEKILFARELITLKKDVKIPSEKELKRSKSNINASQFLKSWELNRIANDFGISLNTEDITVNSTSFDKIKGEIIGLMKIDSLWYCGNKSGITRLQEENLKKLEYFKAIITDNYKEFLNEYKLYCRNYFDIGTASYLLDPEKGNYDFISLVRRYLNLYLSPLECLNNSEEIYFKIKKNIEEKKLKNLLFEIEFPLIPIVHKMEEKGVLIDLDIIKKMKNELERNLSDIEVKIIETAGIFVNPRSPKQVAELLFDILKLPVIKKTKTGRSTDAEVLEKLSGKHSVVNELLQHRFLSKLLSTYIDVIPGMVDEERRLHCKFNLRATATGRFSSSDPNLQNIPIRNKRAREIRKAFIAPSGWKLISADYSQIELRLAAHLSRDRTFIEAFNNDEDIHARTAVELFKVDSEQVDIEMRTMAKTVNFGILYGMSSFKLAKDMKISEREASDFINGYFDRFSSIKLWQNELIEYAKVNGEIRTFMGRRRIIRGLNDKSRTERERARRKVLNTPVQGGAADLIKVAMIKLYEALKPYRAYMILQVHDELVFEVHKGDIEVVSDIVKHTMENVIEISVPLSVKINYGDNWFQAHS